MSAQDEPRDPGDPFTREATRLRKNFLEMNLYEGFELAIMLVLTALIMLVTLFATWNLTKEVWQLVLAQRIDPGDMPTFQTVFGNIFTVIIAVLTTLHAMIALRTLTLRAAVIVKLTLTVLIVVLSVCCERSCETKSRNEQKSLFHLPSPSGG